MKYTAILILLTSMLTQTAFAERGRFGPGRDHQGAHLDKMLESLQLSSEQEPVVRQIMEEQHTKLRAEMEAIHEQIRPKMEALKVETSERLSTVLSAEQMQTFNTQMEERHEKMRDRKMRWRGKSKEDSGN